LDEIIGLGCRVLRSPHSNCLAEEGWSSVHTVINRTSFWEVYPGALKTGAEGYIWLPLEKMVL